MTEATLASARAWFAEDLRYVAPVRACDAVVRAFASVPRERFLGPGPWTLIPHVGHPFATPDGDPKHLCHDVLVVIDADRDLNNGQPSLWAHLYDQVHPKPGERVLHIGCGPGYYSAILAEIVGRAGQVTAIEIDPRLAEMAVRNLADWPQAKVVQADAAETGSGLCDVIIVNAGVTDILPGWLSALAPGGRLLVPLTNEEGGGAFLKVIRKKAGFAATFVCRTGIYHCRSVRNPDRAQRLGEAFAVAGRGLPAVRSLHLGEADGDADCWFQGDGFWLSTEPLDN